ncbi:MAG: PSD1 and planctomycete cytochrome C domain-containing protein, partial [Pirellulaceae bacterium]
MPEQILFRQTNRTAVGVCAVAAFVIALSFSILDSTQTIVAQNVAAASAGREDRIDFARDVWPILSGKCLRCHGPDEQESGFRLDQRDHALSGGDEHSPNIVPGKSGESNLIKFVSGMVAGMQMPPEGKPLTADQIDVLRRWIDQGAEWTDVSAAAKATALDWWSLKPLLSRPIPVLQTGCRNELDAFVRAKLSALGLEPSPEADRRTLIRRVYFDLIGLPPTPEEIEEFVTNQATDAYEQLVDELLASPRYGERWARHWMDAAHFAETHGHDQDRIRENAWPYRDYLINALNSDKPFERFVQEQIAGDVLFPDDPSATVALGFLVAGPWDESSLRDIREDTLDRQIGHYLDRDDMISNVMNNFVSSTVQCARCHDHKFDPISQADYYALQAVFSGIERANRAFDTDPVVSRQRRSLRERKRELEGMSPARSEELLSPVVQQEVATWELELTKARAAWKSLAPETALSAGGATLTPLEEHSVLASGTNPEQDTYTISFAPPAGEFPALRLETLVDDSLPHKGPGRQDNGNLHLSELEIFSGGVDGSRQEIARATADFEQADWGIARAIDGNPQTAWGIYPKVGQSHSAVFEFKEKQSWSAGQKLTVVVKQLHGGRHLIGRIRIAISDSPTSVYIATMPANIEAILAEASEKRTKDQKIELARYQQVAKIEAALARLPAPSYVYAATDEFEPDGGHKPPPGPRPIHILKRGDIRQPLAEAAPGSLACISELPARFLLNDLADEGERRAALARWLTDPKNTLTWRSIVNRVWQLHFGRGIVATPNDFGRMGAVPSHPELLDWLAVWFRDNGQSLKQLHRLIVTSATYRQASAGRPNDSASMTLDADNQFLWRMNRTRLDAESVRDAVLTVAGKLDLRMGGPSDRQFDLKPGSHVTPIIDYSKFDLGSPLGNRRSIYRFLFRTLPDPFMESLDCPAGDTITPGRENSVTVQQALAMWNDAFIARQCE